MSATKLQSNNLVDSVPANWNTTLLRFLLKKKITDGPHETPEFVDEGYPFLSVDGIQNGELVFEGCRFISEEAHLEYSKKVKPLKGDLLMGKAASTGKIAQVKVDFEFSIWSPLAWIRPNEMISSDFLELALKSDYCQAQIEMLCTNSTQNNISMQDIPRIRIHHPTRNDQDNISRFLKEKISKLNIVEEQLNLELNLLEEKRSALITQAVTKGLNPDVAMKETGLDWYPEVPSHWKLRRVKHIATISPSNVDKKKYDGQEEVRLANYVDVYYNDRITEKLELMAATASENEIAKFSLKAGDLIITKDSETWDDIAVSAFVPATMEGVVCGYHLTLIRPNQENVLGEFLFRTYQALGVRDQYHYNANGVTRYGLGSYWVDNGVVPIPPLDEQHVIAEYIDKNLQIMKDGEVNILSQIEKLKEFRVSLTSAAVTGKIDVQSL